jgi:exodeoxyribonuclease-1
VLDEAAQARIKIDLPTVQQHLAKLRKAKDWPEKLTHALEILNQKEQTSFLAHEQEVDSKLYDGFFDTHDSNLLPVVRAAHPEELSQLIDDMRDLRLKALLPLYKARNYPTSLTSEERQTWEAFCQRRLIGTKDRSPLARYMQRLEELGQRAKTDAERYLLEELRLYGESLMPTEPA